MKKDIFTYTSLSIVVLIGIMLTNFLGGLLTGASLVLLLLLIVGKRQAKKAIDRVDGYVKNLLVSNME